MTLDEHGELRFGAIKEELKDILALELKLPAVDLIRCGGGPRCMSCPVNRDDL